MKRRFLMSITPFAMGLLLFGGCAGSGDEAAVTDGNDVVAEDNGNSIAAEEAADTESALRIAQQDGQTHFMTTKVEEIVHLASGIFKTMDPFEPTPFSSKDALFDVAFGQAAYAAGETSPADVGDSGVTEEGNEWIILAEDFDPESGLYTVSIKVTINNVRDARDFVIFHYGIDTRGTREHEDDILVSYSADESFRDGMIGHIDTRSLDDDPDLLSGVLLVVHGLARIDEHPEIEHVTYGHVVELNDPTTAEDDLITSIGRDTNFTNGVTVEERLIPDPPVAPGEEIRNGHYTQLVTFPEGDLDTYSKEVDFREDGSGIMEEVWTFSDESVSQRVTRFDGEGHVAVEGKDRNGTSYEAQYDFNEGKWHKLIVLPEDADTPVAQIEEAGIAQFDDEGNGQGGFKRTVTFRDGSVYESTTKFEKQGNKIRTHTEDTDSNVGDLLITLNPASASLEGRSTDGEGVTTDYIELIYPDHTANLLSVTDDPATRNEPDADAEIDFAADGSGIGTIVVYRKNKSRTFRVLFNADGTGTVIDDQGNHHPFGY